MDRIVVALTGASGAPYGVRLLAALRPLEVEVHLVVSAAAELVFRHEGDGDWRAVLALADVVHDNADLAAPIASGSFRVRGMAIMPCSTTTLGKLAAGIADNLVTRAAAVMLKERRRLVLVPRETPLSTIHLEQMTRLSRAGAVIAPAMPAFYNRPQTIDDNLDFIAGRVLDLLGLETELYPRWQGGEV